MQPSPLTSGDVRSTLQDERDDDQPDADVPELQCRFEKERPDRREAPDHHQEHAGADAQPDVSASHPRALPPLGGYLSSSLSSRRDTIARPAKPITSRYATWTSVCGPTTPTVSCRSRSTPWYSGVSWTTIRSQLREAVEREERAAEQEHRQDDELDQVEVLPRPHERGRGHANRGEREADQQRAGHGQEDQRRAHEPENEHHGQEAESRRGRRGSAPSRARPARCRPATSASSGSRRTSCRS